MIILNQKNILGLLLMWVIFFPSLSYSAAAAAGKDEEDAIRHVRSSARGLEFSDYRALSLDGGGAKGAFPAEVLRQIEVDSKLPIIKIFRGGITGTSTGGLIALALSVPQDSDLKKYRPGGEKEGDIGWLHTKALPKFTAKEVGEFYGEAKLLFAGGCECCGPRCKENYKDCCGSINQFLWSLFTCCGCFGCNKNCQGLCGPKYSNAYLHHRLEQMLGDTTLGESIVPVQVVAYDIEHHEPIYFRSWDPKTSGIRMVDAALASSAAPTFFPAISFTHDSVVYKCVDGGLVDNNASLAALVQLKKHLKRKRLGQNEKDFVILSIGTGKKVAASSFEKLKRGGLISWASPAISASMDGTSQVSARLMAELLEPEPEDDPIYYRIQPLLHEDHSAMDDPEVVPYLRGIVRAPIVSDKIERLVNRFREVPPEVVTNYIVEYAKRKGSAARHGDDASAAGASAAAAASSHGDSRTDSADASGDAKS